MTVLRYFAFCLLLLAFLIPNAFGSGFTFDGLGVKARGMGGAFRALADDWSAAYYNPAGYSRILDNTIAGNLAIFHNRFSVKPNVLWGEQYETGFYNGQEIYNHHALVNVPQGAILVRLPVWDETVFGLSIMQLFDQNHSWELFRNIEAYSQADWPYHQFYNNLDVVAFQLTVAKEFMDEKLSVGVGLAVLRGDLIYNGLILHDNPMPLPISSRPCDKVPQWYNNDGNGWGFGFRGGLLYRVNDKVDVGLVYTGASSINISGTSDFAFYMADNPKLIMQNHYSPVSEEYYFLSGNVLRCNSEYETTLDLPASIGVGVSVKANEKLTLAADVEMIFWSRFKGFDFKFSNFNSQMLPPVDFTQLRSLINDISIPVEWEDAGRFMLGANYKLKDFVDLRGGFSVDQTTVNNNTFIPQFMDLYTKYSYSVGVGFEVGFWHLDLATTYSHHADADVAEIFDYDDDNLMDNLPGYYKADVYQTILGISYRF